MSNATPSRLGQIDLANDALALFLKIFSGETLTAFDRESTYRPRHRVRVIPSGKSAQFPVTGLAAASYHVPGTEITGQQIRHGERVINIEDMLIAPVFVASVDELMNHFDMRQIYSNEIGQALAKAYDKDVSRTLSRAARASANLTGGDTGFSAEAAGYATDGDLIWQGIFNAAVAMDQKDIPQSGRHATLKPVQYALVVQSGEPIHADLNVGMNNGSIASGVVRQVAGIPIVKTNNMAQEDDRANTAIPALRRLDYSPIMAQIFHEGAVGTVQLQDITMEQEYDIRRQGDLMLGKYLVGHDYLRPESSGELRSGAPSV